MFGVQCRLIFVSLSTMMNFAFMLKTWFLSWKCLHTNMASGFLTSVGWLFSLILKLVSDFPMHYFLHILRILTAF